MILGIGNDLANIDRIGRTIDRFGARFLDRVYTEIEQATAERRAELCGLLALGLVRLRMRETGEVSDDTGESCLHYPPDQCRHATPTHRRNA